MLLLVTSMVVLEAERVNWIVVGTSLAQCACRVVRQRLHGSIEIKRPEDLKLAVANGLLSVGSEVVVGVECEWSGNAVSRFSITPGLVHEEPGTLMKVIRLTRNRVELKSIPQDGVATHRD
jgi:hypothetical protein